MRNDACRIVGQRTGRWHNTSLRAAVLALVASVWVGCGSTLPPSVSLSGAVTFEGKPVDSGLLMFHRLDHPGSSPVGSDVRNGSFSAPIVPIGKYRVVLQPPQRTITSSADFLEPPEPQERTSVQRPPEATVDVVASSTAFDVQLVGHETKK